MVGDNFGVNTGHSSSVFLFNRGWRNGRWIWLLRDAAWILPSSGRRLGWNWTRHSAIDALSFGSFTRANWERSAVDSWVSIVAVAHRV